MTSECKFNIAVQTLHVQQLTPMGLLLSFMSSYTLNYPTQNTSMLQKSVPLVSQLETKRMEHSSGQKE